MKPFFTTAEASKILNVSVSTIQKWVEMELLDSWKTPGGHRRITAESIRNLTQVHKNQINGDTSPYSSIERQVLKVSIIEDDFDLLRLYRLKMENWNLPLQINYYDDSVKALLNMENNKPDLVLLDIGLPKFDGHGVLKAIRKSQILNDVYIVIVSGHASAEKYALGADKMSTLIKKPINFQKLKECIIYCGALIFRDNELKEREENA